MVELAKKVMTIMRDASSDGRRPPSAQARRAVCVEECALPPRISPFPSLGMRKDTRKCTGECRKKDAHLQTKRCVLLWFAPPISGRGLRVGGVMNRDVAGEQKARDFCCCTALLVFSFCLPGHAERVATHRMLPNRALSLPSLDTRASPRPPAPVSAAGVRRRRRAALVDPDVCFLCVLRIRRSRNAFHFEQSLCYGAA